MPQEEKIKYLKVFSVIILVIGIFSFGWPKIWVQFFPMGIHEAKAATCTASGAGTTWNSTTTWDCGHVPTIATADDVAIPSGKTVTMDLSSNAGANSLSITGTLAFSSAYTVTISTGGVTVNSTGNVTGSVAGIITTSGSLTVNNTITSTTVSLTMTGVGTTISGTGTVPFLTVNNTVTNNGTLTVSTKLAGSSTLTQGTSSILNIGATSANLTITGLNATTNTPNLVNYNLNGAQTVKAVTYYNLSLNGGNTKTLTSLTTINNNLSLDNSVAATTAANMTIGGTLTISSGTFTVGSNYTLAVTGTVSISGTLVNGGTGAKTYNDNVTINSGGNMTSTGAATVTFKKNLTNNSSVISLATGTITFDANTPTISGSGAVSIANLAVNTVTLLNSLTGSASLSATTALTGTGTLKQDTNANLNIGAAAASLTITGLDATTNTPNTVNYNLNGAQTVKAVTYYYLTLSTGGAKTLTSLTTVNSDLTLSGAATATTAANLAVGGNLIISGGTFTVGSNYTLDVTGTTSVTGTLANGGTAAKTYTGAVSINSGGAITVTGTGTITYSNNVTVNSGGNMTCASAATVYFKKNLTNNRGSAISLAAGTITFDANTPAIGGNSPVSIANLAVNTVTLLNSLSGSNNLTVTTALSGSGTLQQDINANLIIGVATASLTINNIDANTNSGNTVTYSYIGGTQKVFGTNYQNLTVNATGDVATLGGDTVVNAALTITLGTLQLSSYNFTANSTSSITGILNDNSATGSNLFVGAVTINSGGTWTATTNNPAFEFRSGLTMNGSAFNSGSGNYTFTTNDQNIGGSTAFTISNIVVTGINLTNQSTAGLSVGTDLGGTGTFIQGTNSNVILRASCDITNFTTTTAGNTVTYYFSSGGTMRSGSQTYYNLTIEGSCTSGGNITVNNNLQIGLNSLGGTFQLSTYDLTVNGATNVGDGNIYGQLNDNSSSGTNLLKGLVSINATSSWNASGNPNYEFQGGLAMNSAGSFSPGTGIYKFSTNSQNIGGTYGLAFANLESDVILTNQSTAGITISTSLSGSGSWVQNTNASLLIGGSVTVASLSATASGNTVSYNSTTGNQTIFGTAYANLTIAKLGRIGTLGGNTTVNGTLNISAGNLDADNTNNYTLNLNGNYSNSGTFTARHGTVILGGSSQQTLSGAMTSGSAFYNLSITNNSGSYAGSCGSATPGVIFAAAAAVSHNYTITMDNVRVQYLSGAAYTFSNVEWAASNGNPIVFRNSATSGAWNLNVSGTQIAVKNVDVGRSNASSSASEITDANGADCLNNSNWLFGGGISIATAAFEQWDTINQTCNIDTLDEGAAICKSQFIFTPTNWIGHNTSTGYSHGLKLYFGPGFDLSNTTLSNITISSPLIINSSKSYINNASVGCADAICLDFQGNYSTTGAVTVTIDNVTYDNHVMVLPSYGTSEFDINTYNYASSSTPWLDGLLIDQGSTNLGITYSRSSYSMNVTLMIDPELTFSLSANSCSLGTFDAAKIKTCSYYSTVTTNSIGGYSEYIREDHKFELAGGHEMADVTTNLTPGSEAYGLVTLADPTSTSECDGYNDTDTPLAATALSTSDSLFWANSAAVDDIVAFCPGVTIGYNTPPGIYSNAIIITVIANF